MEVSKFCTFPTELVDLVTSYLELEDAQQLRLVCRDLYARTIDYYTSQYVKHIKTDLSASSLDAISAFSKQARARLYIRTFRLEIGCPSWKNRGSIPKCIHKRTDAPRPDWPRIPPSDGRMKTLGDNLRNDLVNCRAFDIAHLAHMFCERPTSLSMASTFAALMAMIADTELPIKSFQLETWQSLEIIREMGDYTRYPEMMRPGFRTAWAHVQNLQVASKIPPREQCRYTLFQDLIRSAPNLQTLRIAHLRWHGRSFFRDIYVGKSFPSMIQHLYLDHLRIQGYILCFILRHLRGSLLTLSLRKAEFPTERDWQIVSKEIMRLSALMTISVRELFEPSKEYYRDFMIALEPARYAAFMSFPDLEDDDSFIKSQLRQQSTLVEAMNRSSRYRVIGIIYSGPNIAEIIGRLQNTQSETFFSAEVRTQ